MAYQDFMQRAVKLARKGLGSTRPNPPVGALVVKDGRIIGQGYHRAAGKPHAEIDALSNCSESPVGADLYVTLEPCSTQGRTGACTESIYQMGIKRVFVGATDPSEANGSRAQNLLEAKGIEYYAGVLQHECEALIAPFCRFTLDQRPWVTLKAGVSLDGRIACANGHSQWITGKKARRSAHCLRRQMDAVLVGAETFRKDNPRLTARSENNTLKVPLRIVLFSGGELPESHHLLTEHAEQTLLVVDKPILSADLKDKGVQEWVYTSREKCLAELMRELHRREIIHLLVEGGGQTHVAFWNADFVDEVCLYVAPIILGEGPLWLPTVQTAPTSVQKALRLKGVLHQRMDEDMMIRGYIERDSAHV